MAKRTVGRRRADTKSNRGRRLEIPRGHGHGHGHGHGSEVIDTSVVDADAVVARRVRIVVAAVLIPLIAAAVIAMIVLWPGGDLRVPAAEQHGASGTVVGLKACPETPADCDEATVKLRGAPDGDKGKEVRVEVPKGKNAAVPIKVGDRLLLGVQVGAPLADKYQYVDHDRSIPLALLCGIFAVAVIALSRWRGVSALIALGVTALTLTQFILPAILKGSNPLLVAVVGGSVIMVVALYLTHGINAQSSVALAGTIAALGLTAFLGWAFVKVSAFSGLGNDGSVIKAYVPGVDLAGLLVAGIVIGALGVLDDVTVTQASAVWELSAANPAASRSQLIGAGLRIGRAHVASVVNTLVLAYAGAALPTLMMFAISGVSTGYLITTETVAVEVVRGLVGSLGIIAAVPLTTALAAMAVADRSRELVGGPERVAAAGESADSA
ncbi:YibE/F family protein [Streptomyces sp. SID13031]|uniref:YibE/F family protein n=1 Tax=Streptomyces sp. SID13031 TaxID=2706046 RepID=UPI0013C8009B|nr:YibE/F family protein [Streptomyces sp. SID13031]NEA37161.1 YibE/F family protein [Streptomyces sp. SID13031]